MGDGAGGGIPGCGFIFVGTTIGHHPFMRPSIPFHSLERGCCVHEGLHHLSMHLASARKLHSMTSPAPELAEFLHPPLPEVGGALRSRIREITHRWVDVVRERIPEMKQLPHEEI